MSSPLFFNCLLAFLYPSSDCCGCRDILLLKPSNLIKYWSGSHMPPMYLEHRNDIRYVNIYRRIITCLRPPASTSQASRQATKIFYVNIICGRKISRKTFRSINRWNGWNCSNSICIRANLIAAGTHWNRSPNVASCNRRPRRRWYGSVGYENQA